MLLAIARIISGMSLKQASEKLNVKVSTLIRWEQYKTSPSLENACKLSNLYGIPIGMIDWCPEDYKRQRN